jgi:hypothetical protein
MRRQSAPSGINSVEPPAKGSLPHQAIEHYLNGYELQYKDARRVAKKRASRVTLAIAILTGCLTTLGSFGALLATDAISAGIAVTTTVVSAAIAVLLAWNDHFHHRQLWIQRSGVLAQLNELRRDYAFESAQAGPRGVPSRRVSERAMRHLNDILADDLDEWRQIQTV